MTITRKLVAAAVCTGTAAAVLLPAGAASAAPGDRSERRVLVTHWTAVRADDENGRDVARLQKGQWVKIKAFGVANCNENNSGANEDDCVHGPDGIDAAAPDDWTAPDLDMFSLVGAVGDDDLESVGSGPTKLRGKGVVTLVYNDLAGAYDDNDGGFVVKVTKCVRGC